MLVSSPSESFLVYRYKRPWDGILRWDRPKEREEGTGIRKRAGTIFSLQVGRPGVVSRLEAKAWSHPTRLASVSARFSCSYYCCWGTTAWHHHHCITFIFTLHASRQFSRARQTSKMGVLTKTVPHNAAFLAKMRHLLHLGLHHIPFLRIPVPRRPQPVYSYSAKSIYIHHWPSLWQQFNSYSGVSMRNNRNREQVFISTRLS